VAISHAEATQARVDIVSCSSSIVLNNIKQVTNSSP
jgi:hypothetical protein